MFARMNTIALTTLVLVGLMAVTTAQAQDKPKSDTEGLFLNLHLNGTSWDLSDDTDFGELPSESGGGLGFAFGFGASQTLTLFAAFDAARINAADDGEDYNLVHFDLGAMITLLGQSSRFRPFGKASFTARTAEFELENIAISSFGAAFSAGAGLMVFLSPAFAITADGTATWGSMTELTTAGVALDLNLPARSFRINGGLSWFPGR
jgi:hypothetical protein